MCEPMSIVSGVLAVTSAVAGGISARQQAKAQNEYNQIMAANYAKAAELNNQAAVKEYTEQSAAERIAQMQENEATAIQKQEARIEALRKQGTMLASSNSAGIALDLLLGDYERQYGANMQKLDTQKQNTAVNAELGLASYKDKAQNRINSQQGYTYMQSDNSAMNTIGTALGIGQGIVGAYGNYQNWKSKE